MSLKGLSSVSKMLITQQCGNDNVHNLATTFGYKTNIESDQKKGKGNGLIFIAMNMTTWSNQLCWSTGDVVCYGGGVLCSYRVVLIEDA